jgi:tetratricopeptide (TPR) repeat protein
VNARAAGLRRGRSRAVAAVVVVALLAGCASSAQFLWEEYNSAGIDAARAGRYAQAEMYFNRAAQKAEDLGPFELGRSLNNLGELARVRGRLTEAERYFKRALAVKETGLGLDDPDVATSLRNLVEVYVAQGRPGDAVPLLERSLAIQEKALGAEHPALRGTLTMLADLYRKLGRENDAFVTEVRIRLLRPE